MKDILRLSVPLSLWLFCFSAIYGLQGLLCSERVNQLSSAAADGLFTDRILLGAAWGAAVAMQVVLVVLLRSSRLSASSPFIRRVSTGLAVVALIATLWAFLPIVTTTTCH